MHIYFTWRHFRSIDIKVGKLGILLSLVRSWYRGYINILWDNKVKFKFIEGRE
ncbi:hypothetical protein LCGC14_1980530 [marine sediment metagenome]|uniref:Uncharacterized protein n=1 Tax=marine sediment metagenome TaxID=412755 RepID=A0A0F9I618_9ZZZZ